MTPHRTHCTLQAHRPHPFLVRTIRGLRTALNVFIGLLAMLALPLLDLANAHAQTQTDSQSYTESFNTLKNGSYGDKARSTLTALSGQPLFNGQWVVSAGDPKVKVEDRDAFILFKKNDGFSFVMSLQQAADVSFSFDVRTSDEDKTRRYILGASGPDFSASSGVIAVRGVDDRQPSRRDSYRWDDLQAGTYTFSFEVLDDQLRLDNARFDALALPSVTAVPEPQGWAMLAAGLGAIGFLSRRRTSTAPRDLA